MNCERCGHDKSYHVWGGLWECDYLIGFENAEHKYCYCTDFVGIDDD